MSLVLLAAILIGCGPAVPLVGTITDAYTGQPINGARVVVGATEITTDPGGRFETLSWSMSDSLEVVAPGYEMVQIPLDKQPQLQSPAPPAVTLDAVLRPNVLRGTVTDAYTNKPLAGAQMLVAGTSISATSAADGAFLLEGVPETFTLQFAAPGYEAVNHELKRSITFETRLRPNVLSGKLIDGATNKPVAGARISFGSSKATSAEDGTFRLKDVPEKGIFVAEAQGYARVETPLAETTSYEAKLRPDVLSGKVVNASTGKPLDHFTVVAGESLKKSATTLVRVDDSKDGSFELEDMPTKGYVQVFAPGYEKKVLEIKDGVVPAQIEMKPFQVKALYITAGVASHPDLLEQYLDAIDTTELNTIVIDLKSDMRDDLGLVYYDSQVPMVKEFKTSIPAMNLKEILADTKRRKIYTIARIQLFSHDNALADAMPEWAVQDRTTGEVYADYPGPGIRYAWLDPWNKNVWEYNIQLGEEAALLGFDEVNYDYIRFPDKGDDEYKEEIKFSKPTDPSTKAGQDAMYENIADFLKEAHPRINKAGSYISIDVFGRAAVAPARYISQDIPRLAEYCDYVAPMIYPSLWWPGYLDLDNPTAHPYEVILGTLNHSKPFFKGKYAQNRPWIQDHTDPWQGDRVVEYGPKEVRAQLDAVADFDPQLGWMLYNSANVYTSEALDPE